MRPRRRHHQTIDRHESGVFQLSPVTPDKTSRTVVPAVVDIARGILVLRRQRVILDAELAGLYGVTTKRLNEQVKRNATRFPEDFLFRLTTQETEAVNRSQFATGHQKHRDQAIAAILSAVRELTHLPESGRRGIGFTADRGKPE